MGLGYLNKMWSVEGSAGDRGFADRLWPDGGEYLHFLKLRPTRGPLLMACI